MAKAMPGALGAALAPVRQIGLLHLARALPTSLVRGRLPSVSRHTLLRLWQGYGGREAVIDGHQRISFDVFADRTVRLANVLHDNGLRPGDSMALLVGNGSLWFEAMAATTLMGIRMPLINWHLSSEETGACIRVSGARALLVDASFVPRLDESTRRQLDLILVSGDDPIPADARQLEPALANAATVLPPGGFGYSPKVFSGGTTGTPKFIDLDRKTLKRRQRSGQAPGRMAMLRLLRRMLALPGLLGLDRIHDPVSGNIRSLIPSPLYHAGGQAAALPILMGGTVVPMRKFDAEGFLHLIEHERINWTFVTPTMLERILALPNDVQDRYDLSSLRLMMCSAAPCPAQVKQQINQLFRRRGNPEDVFFEFYGSSEAGPVTLLTPADYRATPARYASVGKPRLGDCRIYDIEHKRWAETGEDGRILLRSPAVYALAYGGRNERAMRQHFIDVDGEPWYDDGLIGHLDGDGFLYITGREKEMLIVGGVNIYPNEIEETLKRHALVQDAAVVPMADRDLGEVPVAVISLHDQDRSVSANEILVFCEQEGLYGFKLPRRVLIADQLPRDAAGKLRKRQIIDEYVN